MVGLEVVTLFQFERICGIFETESCHLFWQICFVVVYRLHTYSRYRLSSPLTNLSFIWQNAVSEMCIPLINSLDYFPVQGAKITRAMKRNSKEKSWSSPKEKPETLRYIISLRIILCGNLEDCFALCGGGSWRTLHSHKVQVNGTKKIAQPHPCAVISHKKSYTKNVPCFLLNCQNPQNLSECKPPPQEPFHYQMNQWTI